MRPRIHLLHERGPDLDASTLPICSAQGSSSSPAGVFMRRVELEFFPRPRSGLGVPTVGGIAGR